MPIIKMVNELHLIGRSDHMENWTRAALTVSAEQRMSPSSHHREDESCVSLSGLGPAGLTLGTWSHAGKGSEPQIQALPAAASLGDRRATPGRLNIICSSYLLLSQQAFALRQRAGFAELSSSVCFGAEWSSSGCPVSPPLSHAWDSCEPGHCSRSGGDRGQTPGSIRERRA